MWKSPAATARGRAPGPEVHGRRRGGRQDRRVGPVPEPAREALAPAAEGAVGENCARMLDPGVDVAGLDGPDGRRRGLGIGARRHDQGERGDERTGGRQPRPTEGGAGHVRPLRTTAPRASHHGPGATKLGGPCRPRSSSGPQRPTTRAPSGRSTTRRPRAVLPHSRRGRTPPRSGAPGWRAAASAPRCGARSRRTARWRRGRRSPPSPTAPGTRAWPSTRSTSPPRARAGASGAGCSTPCSGRRPGTATGSWSG